MGAIDARVVVPARRLAARLAAVVDGALVGVWVHGSAVLGDFVEGVSDLDVIIVVEDDIGPHSIRGLADVLGAADVWPAVGVEASVVTRSFALRPDAPWPFLVHVTTAPGVEKVVDGSGHPGDRDLVLHVAVARDHGWSAGDPVAASAPSPSDVFGEVAHQTVVGQLAAELRWAAEHAPASYAVLNACRALRFVTDGSLCSKTSGGEWAIAAGIEPDLVSCALALRRGSAATVPEAAARRWVLSVGRSLEE